MYCQHNYCTVKKSYFTQNLVVENFIIWVKLIFKNLFTCYKKNNFWKLMLPFLWYNNFFNLKLLRSILKTAGSVI